MEFYYDDLINNEDNTFELFLYKNSNQTDKNGAKITAISKADGKDTGKATGDEIVSLVKCILNDNPSLSIITQWGSASTLLSDLAATAQSAISSIGIQLKRLYEGATDTIDTFKNLGSGEKRVREYTQESIYNINEYIKTFKGIGNNIPLSKSFSIYPYLDNSKNYITVEEQLDTLLNALYNFNGKGMIDEDTASEVEKETTATTTNENGENIVTKVINTLIDFGSTDVSDGTVNSVSKVLRFKAPHGYNGVPNSFLDGSWMQGTLAIRHNGRWIYNLLLNELTINVSRWNITWKDNSSSIEKANITLSLIPATMITPNEQMRYLYNYTPVTTPTEDTKKS